MENEEPKSGTAEFVKTTLFKQEGGFTYRIPSLLYLPESRTYLAFAEKRTSSADHDTKCLVIRRMTTTVDPTQWSPSKELYEDLKIDQLPNHRHMNPCPVYDSNTQTVFLFYISVPGQVTEQTQIREWRNQARLCCVSTRDQGVTWGVPEDLTESVFGEILANVSTLAVGPGHGVQLESGRLVVPAYAYYRSFMFWGLIPGPVKQRALSIYRDKDESQWLAGELLGTGSGECEMAEVMAGDGTAYLYCNARSSKGFRLEAWSTDRGGRFEEPRKAEQLVETGTGCQGSVIGFPAPKPLAGTQTWLAFSHPTDGNERKNMGVYLNRDPLGDRSWDQPTLVHDGPSGYSDLAYNQDKQSFSCLLECGEKSELEQIAFMSFTLDEIRQTSS